MSPRLKPLFILALLPLGACGFTPLYGGDSGSVVSQKLDTVDVANIPERPGQMLRISLETQMHGDGQPSEQLYALNVSYSVAAVGIGIQQDTSVTRTRFVATAHWALTPIGNPAAPLTHGIATTEDALNVIDQQYFALTLETDTVNQQLADEIAAQITTQVAAYFKTHPNA